LGKYIDICFTQSLINIDQYYNELRQKIVDIMRIDTHYIYNFDIDIIDYNYNCRYNENYYY